LGYDCNERVGGTNDILTHGICSCVVLVRCVYAARCATIWAPRFANPRWRNADPRRRMVPARRMACV
jgi:hypothetical protein